MIFNYKLSQSLANFTLPMICKIYDMLKYCKMMLNFFRDQIAVSLEHMLKFLVLAAYLAAKFTSLMKN